MVCVVIFSKTILVNVKNIAVINKPKDFHCNNFLKKFREAGQKANWAVIIKIVPLSTFKNRDNFSNFELIRNVSSLEG